jgi:polysaccharide biosynthesis/export protein
MVRFIQLVGCFSLFSIFFACTPQYKLQYLRDLPDTGTVNLSYKLPEEIRIQPDDMLTINISGKNPETSLLINAGGVASTNETSTTNRSAQAPGNNYLVDTKGEIELMLIGKLKVTGKTIVELKSELTLLAQKYLLEPIVTVRFTGLRITVMGEVKIPNTYSVANEKITILQALGYAGDLTSFAQRESVKVVREIDGKREIGTVNLASADIFSSPYYFLKQNDVVYVPPTNQKYAAENAARVTLPYVSIGVGLVTLLISAIQLLR